LGFKGKDRGTRVAVESRSRVHGVLFAWHDPTKRLYLVDERIGRWNYPEARAVFVAAQGAEPWSRAIAVLVEDKASGTDLISELRELVPAIAPWEPHGSKEDRARRHSARVESGVLWIPRAAWAEEWRGELVRFPRQKANDRVDTATMALDYLYQPGGIARMQLAGLADFFRRP
ncbi:MAG: phage terminase large subunit, partial [Bacteroidales bacterium]|nr:phage terminase large subunit [Bacteroidales bacterium]